MLVRKAAQTCFTFFPSAIGCSEKPGIPSFMTTTQTDRKGRTATCVVDSGHGITKKRLLDNCYPEQYFFFSNATNPLVRINAMDDALYLF